VHDLTTELEDLRAAAELLATAERVLISTGAGMSADSGVPTYRDEDGLWRDFEPFTSKGLNPADIAHVDGYQRDPHQAWGFHEYIRRVMASSKPHEGYDVVTRWLRDVWPESSFLLTTNVDGYHRRSGVDEHRMWERYGNIWELMCVTPCSDEWWPEPRAPLFDIDPATMRAVDIPRCPFCGAAARPRTHLAHGEFLSKGAGAKRYERFIDTQVDVYVVIGTTLWFSWPDEITDRPAIIHINPSAATHDRYDEPHAITMGARDALLGLDFMLRRLNC